MKKSFLLFSFLATAFFTNAQKSKTSKEPVNNEIKIPMEPAYWKFDSTATEFVTYKSTSAARGKNGGPFQIFLKDYNFKNGVIEFDVELDGMGFPGINFRMSNDQKNGENFYIRSFGPVSPQTRTTLQYAALMDGMSIWNLSDEYQAGAFIYQHQWNHIKLIISGRQMKAFVNDMDKPALLVPELEGLQDSCSISLSGNVIFANLVIKPNISEGLGAGSTYASTHNDTRYLRNWMVSEQKDFPFGKDLIMPLPSMYGKLTASDLPDSNTRWKPIESEWRGIVNLSRIYGVRKNDARRIAWLKTTIESEKAQDKILRFGFTDEVWVFINGQILYVDKNYFGTPEQKSEGRCTLDNTTFKVPLKEGKNEILIATANYFYGWGIIARLDNTSGIQFNR